MSPATGSFVIEAHKNVLLRIGGANPNLLAYMTTYHDRF